MLLLESQKQCCFCHQVRPLSEFTFKDQAKGVLHSYCRVCHAAWNREHYLRNRDTYIATARRNSALYYERNTRLVMEYLLQHPCVDCGEADPLVLQFDHREQSAKRLEVSCMIRYYAWAQVEAEIAKCDVRCANCHQRRTAHQLGFRKVLLAIEMAGAAGLEPAKPLVLETSALPIELRP